MNKRTQIGMDLLKVLAHEGDRIFSTERALSVSQQLNINPNYLNEMLFLLKKNHWIYPIKKGLYYLDSAMLAGGPIHEYEIGTSLISPSMISHFSAFHYHHLTDQIPHMIYVSTSKKLGSNRSLKEINHIKYQIIHTKPEYFFGAVGVWIGEAKVPLSDLERTLLDGLRAPQFCGGFGEVLAAYQSAQKRIQVKKIIDYAQRLEISTIKRMGWVLEYIGIPQKQLTPLEKVPIKGFRSLDANGRNFGPYNTKWKIRENI